MKLTKIGICLALYAAINAVNTAGAATHEQEQDALISQALNTQQYANHNRGLIMDMQSDVANTGNDVQVLEKVVVNQDQQLTLHEQQLQTLDKNVSQSQSDINKLSQDQIRQDQALSDEASLRIAGDQANSTALGQEAQTRAHEDVRLQQGADQEVADRLAGDKTNAGLISQETQDRVDGDALNAQKLGDEATQRRGADTQLHADLGAETQARILGDQRNARLMQGEQLQIDNEQIQISNEVVNRINAVNGEARARADGDVRTLKAANDYTDHRIDALAGEFQSNNDKLERGIAGALAATGLHYANGPHGAVSVGYGNYAGQSAVALGVMAHVSAQVDVNLAASYDGEQAGVVAGASLGF
ncbi:YadA C-terminal domain-containing protein [Jeongeupia naejangsanensis]|uniref:YadA C-terminal domain-containing protein n=1 Tax=Jeongeupia naejangsanensis TaxID=613195 RepID=A0ABS2BHD8_9NEIS|nr:YadA C-terminal domain-containing protein [Jeongeupia naejangsanensis]MBM3114865.1 YadA C-terminal domain-containing protein [Jeongeupia naejangsanensis]